MFFYDVEDQKCTRCGICVELCPSEIITIEGDDVPKVSSAGAALCMKCGQCVVYCPTRANSLAFQGEDEITRSSDLALPETEAALNLLRTRRSVRRFKSATVPERDFAKIFDTVRMAPTSANSQAVRWTVSHNPEKTKELAALVVDWLRVIAPEESNPHMKFMARKAIAMADEGRDMVLRGAPHVAVAVTPQTVMEEDGAIALTYFELAAHAMGLGCCWAGLLTLAARAHPPLREYLGISEDEYICGAQMVGFPALLPARQFPPRKMPSITWLK